MINVSNFSKSELVEHNIKLVKELLIGQGYKLAKITQTQTRTDYTISRNNEIFNIKILGYRYNDKSSGNYAYVLKHCFDLTKFKYLYFVLYIDNKPHILKIPSTVFINPAQNSSFKNRDYVGQKSLPEYGIHISKSNINELLMYKDN